MDNKNTEKENYIDDINTSESNIDDEVVTIDQEIEDDDVILENEDYISISMPIEEISNLNEDEIRYLIEKIDITLEKYEDELMRIYEGNDEEDNEEENIDETEEEKLYDDIEDELQNKEYIRLKELRKALYKRLKSLKKIRRESGLLGLVPLWYFIIAFFVFVFTIIPLSPFFPLKLCSLIVNKWPTLFPTADAALIITFVIYNLIFILSELIPLIIYFVKGKKSNEKKEVAKKMLIVFIINIVLMLPAVISYITSYLW